MIDQVTGSMYLEVLLAKISPSAAMGGLFACYGNIYKSLGTCCTSEVPVSARQGLIYAFCNHTRSRIGSYLLSFRARIMIAKRYNPRQYHTLASTAFWSR